jgi:predicted secreted protein
MSLIGWYPIVMLVVIAILFVVMVIGKRRAQRARGER